MIRPSDDFFLILSIYEHYSARILRVIMTFLIIFLVNYIKPGTIIFYIFSFQKTLHTCLHGLEIHKTLHELFQTQFFPPPIVDFLLDLLRSVPACSSSLADTLDWCSDTRRLLLVAGRRKATTIRGSMLVLANLRGIYNE